tara:strand:- start:123 stop:344 length:222 start_codon:yes stop_codon:yes gene_type:complete
MFRSEGRDKSEKEILQELATLVDDLYLNGSYSMYGHSLNESIVACVVELGYQKKIKLNMPKYDQEMQNQCGEG